MSDHEVNTLGVDRRIIDVGRIVPTHGSRESGALAGQDVIGVVVESVHLHAQKPVPQGRVESDVVGKVTLP